ncbi:(2Fe-2S)-binding protein [Pseudonocardia sp. KRD-184]|uniref:(2Fe-2S)-binding protein n=1 Tax=Pseudonocardia oceani TaxID=2792013 RepID=A0ABS6U864_9PSEU|nr:(2Fe-2S)-binding protein [Pseudonocardia oceani]MBW0088682.1 (2Fe-2S)-binding protein [Pseudonocardia oceani]MBW0095559.1 (2Fe-2S)-binding protein [Pseudonocardia oceani]MBW0108203.1 (2Fe-2S)-binding protein [Pseudonocardia oceani]MBW0120660.1 (2Fe-2S)-binding protein [Pseudonocardia oceani]MBW0128406.1 (2Fe-2S)-binding protein [Pseudonocardia oceani]
MHDRHLITLTVNDEEHEVVVEARRTLLDVLRHDLRLTGAHAGCEHGVCGACTVLVDGAPARACLLFAVQAEGSALHTVESLAAPSGELSDLQRAFSRHHGLQCGFCTPGFLMLAEGWLAERAATGAGEPDREEVREMASANLCRCTGYQTIVDAIADTARTRLAAPGETA